MIGHLGYTEVGEAVAHTHALFARPDGSLFGGHLFTGAIMLTLEITIALHSLVGWFMQLHDPEFLVSMSISHRAFRPHSVRS